MKKETIAIHAGYTTDPTTKSVAVPIYQTVAYEFDDAQHGADLFDLAVPGNIYSRIMNPTNDVLEQRLAAMEGGIAGLAVGSGMAAINYAILTLAKAGDNIVTTPQLYGGTYTLFAHMLPSQGIEVRFAEDDSAEALEALIDDNTKAVARLLLPAFAEHCSHLLRAQLLGTKMTTKPFQKKQEKRPVLFDNLPEMNRYFLQQVKI